MNWGNRGLITARVDFSKSVRSPHLSIKRPLSRRLGDEGFESAPAAARQTLANFPVPTCVSTVSWQNSEKAGRRQNDNRAWLLDNNSGLNYTIALRVGCGCETRADCREGTKRKGEKVFAELLPSGEL
jgi:hypothetical protein